MFFRKATDLFYPQQHVTAETLTMVWADGLGLMSWADGLGLEDWANGLGLEDVLMALNRWLF